jgi:hypothetical protein
MTLLGQLGDTDPTWWTIGFVIVFLGPVALALWLMNRPKPRRGPLLQKDSRRGFEVLPTREKDEDENDTGGG